MKRYFPAIALFLWIWFIPSGDAIPASNGGDSGLYQWTDENGTISFSDNVKSVPGKKGVRKRASIKGEVPSDQTRQEKADGYPPKVLAKLYGGHDESWWHGRFAGMRERIKAIKEALPEKREMLRTAHIKKVASDSLGYPTIDHGNHWENRRIYKKLYFEIKADEEKLAALEKELEATDTEASRAGVPLEWRK